METAGSQSIFPHFFYTRLCHEDDKVFPARIQNFQERADIHPRNPDTGFPDRKIFSLKRRRNLLGRNSPAGWNFDGKPMCRFDFRADVLQNTAGILRESSCVLFPRCAPAARAHPKKKNRSVRVCFQFRSFSAFIIRIENKTVMIEFF